MSVLLLALLAADPLLEDYAATVTGAFTTEAQHRADARYDIVEARIVRLWPERTDAVWLYQEQAIVNVAGKTPDEARKAPYFQFVARIVALGDGTLRRDNMRLREPARWAGLKDGDPRLTRITPADLADPGCHNRIERIAPGHFASRTETCLNSYKGAVTMRSLSVTTPDTYANWDRGFATDGQRVWGPAEGGYIFRRQR